MNNVFSVQFFEFLEQAHRSVRRVTAQNRQAHAFSIGLEFLILVVAGFPHREGDLHQRTHDAEVQMAQPGLDLHTFSAVIVIDMFHFMPNDESELVLAGHQVEQTLPDIDVAARKGEGIDHCAILHEMKRIGQTPMRVQRNRVTDAAHVTLQRLLFRTYFGGTCTGVSN